MAYEIAMLTLLASQIGGVSVVFAAHERIAARVREPRRARVCEFPPEVVADFAFARSFLERGVVDAYGSVAEAPHRERCGFVEAWPECVVDRTTVSALSAMEVLASALAIASCSLGSMRRLLMIV